MRIRRKGYHRRAHTRKGYTRKDGTRVKPTHVKACYVPPSTYYRRDIGAPGRGRKYIPKLREGLMTREARAIGVLKKHQKLGDISKSGVKKLATHLRKKYGQRRAFGMFHAQVVFRKRQPDGFKHKMKYGRDIARGKPGEWD